MESLIYIANILYLLSYFVDDLLRLRALTITAACCLVAYFALLPEPLIEIIFWNLFFVGLNIVQIARLLRVRNAVKSELRDAPQRP